MWAGVEGCLMLTGLKQYLKRVKIYSKLDPKDESEILRELQTHFEDEIGELCESGLSTDEAADMATKRLGTAKSLGREIYEVYSRGTWGQALLAAAPHFLLALIFALHLWRDSLWIVGVALAIMGVTVYAWCHGRPSWSYPWLGYFLIPLFVLSFLILFAFGQILSLFIAESTVLWIVILSYIPVALFLLGCVVVRVIQRDWLFGSFMLLPFPVVVLWLFALQQGVGLAEYSREGYQFSDQGVASTFLALGVTAGAFIRLRQRILKIGVLTVATLLALAMVWRFAESGVNPVVSFLVSFCFVSFLLSPVLLQGRFAHRAEETEPWEESWLGQAAKRT